MSILLSIRILAIHNLCAVLHTHTRRLDYHPHVHIVIPGGTLNKARREWHKAKDRYLFNGKALAKAFRGAFLRALSDADITTHQTPRKWVVQCQKVGKRHALRYLSRYLYRGVISNRNLIADDGENITFRYRESKTNTWKTRTMPDEEFIHLLLQHCLPKGFRRTRDYGFLHGNAKATMGVLQWIFRVMRRRRALAIKGKRRGHALAVTNRCSALGLSVNRVLPDRSQSGYHPKFI